MKHMTDEGFIAQIEKAFPQTGVPDPAAIVVDFPHDLERVRIREAFTGKEWSSLPLELLRYHSEALYFFTPQAWVYYIPAYLSAMTARYEDSDNISVTVVATVTKHHERYEEFLNHDQRQAIADALGVLLRREDDHPRWAEIRDVIWRFSR